MIWFVSGHAPSRTPAVVGAPYLQLALAQRVPLASFDYLASQLFEKLRILGKRSQERKGPT